ncbi:unnamed protein product, partial [Ectocarpus fasciculatus]
QRYAYEHVLTLFVINLVSFAVRSVRPLPDRRMTYMHVVGLFSTKAHAHMPGRRHALEVVAACSCVSSTHSSYLVLGVKALNQHRLFMEAVLLLCVPHVSDCVFYRISVERRKTG